MFWKNKKTHAGSKIDFYFTFNSKKLYWNLIWSSKNILSSKILFETSIVLDMTDGTCKECRKRSLANF